MPAKDPHGEEVKTLVTKRLDKYLSRESVALVVGALGMLEGSASPELWGLFSLIALVILRGAKAFEAWAAYKSSNGQTVATAKTESVSEVVDTQDKPSDKPSFETEQ